MAYGLTMKQQQRFSAQLAEIINVDAEIISAAIDDITRQEVKRVAFNRAGEPCHIDQRNHVQGQVAPY